MEVSLRWLVDWDSSVVEPGPSCSVGEVAVPRDHHGVLEAKRKHRCEVDRVVSPEAAQLGEVAGAPRDILTDFDQFHLREPLFQGRLRVIELAS